MLRYNRKIHKSVSEEATVEVIEVDGVRSLYLGSLTIQSSMRVKSPFTLELAYSRGMMCFLLFSEQVKHVLSIGLGGGSVPKYIHQFCPEFNQTVVEISPQVIATARSHFYMPENDERLNVIEGDGLIYLANHANTADVLMTDAFDSVGIPPDFCSQDFFDRCELSLKKDGIFVINLWGSDKNFDVYLRRIEQSFNNKVFILPTGKPGNIVVFGLKGVAYNVKHIVRRATQLESTHLIEFKTFADKLIEMNIKEFAHGD